jgi:ribosome-associated protein
MVAMSEAIVLTPFVRVPAHAIRTRAVRASGPGGQNVNKVATKIELRVDPGAIEGLDEAARARLLALARHRLDAEGQLVVTSQRTRNQARNLEDARDKVATLLRAVLAPPRPRKRTRPPASVGEERLAIKKRRAAVKRTRSAPRDDW